MMHSSTILLDFGHSNRSKNPKGYEEAGEGGGFISGTG
jgi:hypothetical protein